MNILYEDNHIIVVIKPRNVPSQQDSSGDTDMLSAVREYIRVKYNKPGNVYTGLVHRLDRPTGGIMVFARTSKAAKRLQRQIKNGEFKKLYLAVTDNIPSEKSAELENWLVKDREKNIVRVSGSETPGAKYASLFYKVICEKHGRALVEIELRTGRSHQIRVQMSHAGAPLCGDAKYGRGGHALCLWAYSLSFSHPTTKKSMRFTFPPPDTAPWNSFGIQMKPQNVNQNSFPG